MSQTDIPSGQDDFSVYAKEAFERLVKPKLRPEDHGKFVVLDPESGEFEIAENELSAARTLKTRLPNSRLWLERVGYKAAHRVGFWR